MSQDFEWPKITDKTERVVTEQLHKTISIYDNSGSIGELEGSLKQYFGTKHSLLFNSGTSALLSLYMSANLQPGDEVICPVYTFFATISPIFFSGAIPIFADCDENGNIDPQDIKRKITTKTKAIIITHMWGNPCEMDEIISICKENKLKLYEDISHAFGAEYKGQKVGTFGDATACSLQGQKVLTGGEGGFIITNNDEIFYKSLLLGHYNKRCKKEIPEDYELSKYSTTGMGLKLRIHPLACAIAKQQFEEINNILEGRKRIAQKIIDELSHIKDLEIITPSEGNTSSWYAMIFKYKGERNLEEIEKELYDKGLQEIDIPGSTKPLNLLPLFQKPEVLYPQYRGKTNYKEGDFPKAESFYKGILKIPVWSTEEEMPIVEKYITKIKEVFS